MSDTTSSSIQGLKVISDNGGGRTYITILDDDGYLPLAQAVSEQLVQRARSVVIRSSAVNVDTWAGLSEALSVTLGQLGVRQDSLIGMGAGATLAQNLALNEPRAVRSMAVIDAAARPHPSQWQRVIDALELRLPFGLPLRLGLRGFNVSSYIHRFRCPLLIVSTKRASAFIRQELQHLACLAPTAWRVDLSAVEGEREGEALAQTILAFQETPVKCPQKNTGAR
jgi:pimeloyl-ACP methyl ester carboxylesterase